MKERSRRASATATMAALSSTPPVVGQASDGVRAKPDHAVPVRDRSRGHAGSPRGPRHGRLGRTASGYRNGSPALEHLPERVLEHARAQPDRLVGLPRRRLRSDRAVGTSPRRALGTASLAACVVLAGNKRARWFYEQHGWPAGGAKDIDWRGDVRLDEVPHRRTLSARLM